MGTFSLVHRDCHTQNAHGPARDNTSPQNHGQILGCALQDCSNGRQQRTHLDCSSTSETIDGEPSREGANSRYSSSIQV